MNSKNTPGGFICELSSNEGSIFGAAGDLFCFIRRSLNVRGWLIFCNRSRVRFEEPNVAQLSKLSA